MEEKCAEALFLYSTFSFQRKETNEVYSKRRIALLEEAARLGQPEALYQLALRFEYGDEVEIDLKRASHFFKLAAEAGHSISKVSYGLDLFHGHNGIAQNQSLGLALLRQSSNENVEGAAYCLEQIETA